MALSQNEHLRACAQMIEDVLKSRGLDVAKSRTKSDGGPAWSLREGSAEVLVFLTEGTGDVHTLQVVAPVMRPTLDALVTGALCRSLLELNANGLHQAAFGLFGGDVVLTADRSTAGLDPIEVEEMIRRVAEYADQYDDSLVAEFGGKRSSDR